MLIASHFTSLQTSWFNANQLPDFHSQTTALHDFHVYFAELLWGTYSDLLRLFPKDVQEQRTLE